LRDSGPAGALGRRRSSSGWAGSGRGSAVGRRLSSSVGAAGVVREAVRLFGGCARYLTAAARRAVGQGGWRRKRRTSGRTGRIPVRSHGPVRRYGWVRVRTGLGGRNTWIAKQITAAAGDFRVIHDQHAQGGKSPDHRAICRVAQVPSLLSHHSRPPPEDRRPALGARRGGGGARTWRSGQRRT
jgi:hypothetical protein